MYDGEGGGGSPYPPPPPQVNLQSREIAVGAAAERRVQEARRLREENDEVTGKALHRRIASMTDGEPPATDEEVHS